MRAPERNAGTACRPGHRRRPRTADGATIAARPDRTSNTQLKSPLFMMPPRRTRGHQHRGPSDPRATGWRTGSRGIVRGKCGPDTSCRAGSRGVASRQSSRRISRRVTPLPVACKSSSPRRRSPPCPSKQPAGSFSAAGRGFSWRWPFAMAQVSCLASYCYHVRPFTAGMRGVIVAQQSANRVCHVLGSRSRDPARAARVSSAADALVLCAIDPRNACMERMPPASAVTTSGASDRW